MENTQINTSDRKIQTTLDQFEFAEDIDPEYGHLVEHLLN